MGEHAVRAQGGAEPPSHLGARPQPPMVDAPPSQVIFAC